MGRWAAILAACAAGVVARAAGAPLPPPPPPAGAPAVAAAPPRVVLLPFENASRRGGAREVVMPAVEAALRAKGWELVSGAPVEAFLRARRIRYLDSLATVNVVELVAAHGADAVVLGSILAYDPDPRNPRATISARLVSRGGSVAWTDVRSASASTTGGAFGRGKATALADVARAVVRELAAGLPADAPRAPPPRQADTFPDGPRVFRSRDYLGQRLRICVLPLQNYSAVPDAARIVDAALQDRLSARPDTATVSPGDLRAAIVRARLQAPSVLSLEQLRDLADALGTPLFLRGTILAYGGLDPSGAAAPVELYLSLLDVRSGQIVWSGLHRRTGTDYEGLLRFGAIRDDAMLASRVVAELLDAFTRRTEP